MDQHIILSCFTKQVHPEFDFYFPENPRFSKNCLCRSSGQDCFPLQTRCPGSAPCRSHFPACFSAAGLFQFQAPSFFFASLLTRKYNPVRGHSNPAHIESPRLPFNCTSSIGSLRLSLMRYAHVADGAFVSRAPSLAFFSVNYPNAFAMSSSMCCRMTSKIWMLNFWNSYSGSSPPIFRRWMPSRISVISARYRDQCLS